MMSQDLGASKVLSNAIKNGVVDTCIHPFPYPLITQLLSIDWKKRTLHHQNPNAFEPYQNPRSTSWQQNALPIWTHVPVNHYVAAEVARFVVPKGQVGFVKTIEQVINDQDGSYYPTNQEYWGSPNFIHPDAAGIRWWLKLDFFNGSDPPRFIFNNAAAFGSEVAPGMPFSEMAEIDALWYPAHSNKEVKLIVPGNRVLRFYYYSPPLVDYIWQVRGRLTGFNQSVHSSETIENARKIF